MNSASEIDSLAIVIPAYNAGDSLATLLDDVNSVLSNSNMSAVSVFVVNDGSTDNSINQISSFQINLLHHKVNKGKGASLKTAYLEAMKNDSINCVAVLDADGQHNPEELPRLFHEFQRQQADFLIGSRVFSGQQVPFRSWFGNKVTQIISAVLLGKWLPDTQSGYRLISRKYLENELPKIRGGRYETEMEMIAKAIRGNYKLVSVPIQTLYEEGNPSSHFRVVRDSIRIYSTLLKMALTRFLPL
jgi:glycosyltransferase involved in cell wall biosynthesis